jgi:diguanylate cyclase (GGDEF)-like protein
LKKSHATLKASRALIRGFACWLALAAGLHAQPYISHACRFHACRLAEVLKSLAAYALTADRNGNFQVVERSGVFRFLDSFCLGLLVLLLAASSLRVRHLRAQCRELERQVNERSRELELSREQLRIQASHDVLTGMLNRVGILHALNAEMDRARREGGTLLVALVDLDYFNLVNDAYGHLAGDEALRWFAAAVGAAIRIYDHAGRYGGSEFLLVLTEIPQEAAEQRLAILHSSISNLEIHTRDAEFGITCSMGATVFGPFAGCESIEALLAAADQALYAAKAEGRNRAVLHRAVFPASEAGMGPAMAGKGFSPEE